MALWRLWWKLVGVSWLSTVRPRAALGAGRAGPRCAKTVREGPASGPGSLSAKSLRGGPRLLRKP